MTKLIDYGYNNPKTISRKNQSGHQSVIGNTNIYDNIINTEYFFDSQEYSVVPLFIRIKHSISFLLEM